MFREIVMIDYQRPLAQRRYSGRYRWRPATPGTGRGFYQAQHGLACDPRGSTFALRLVSANDLLAHSRLRFVSGYYTDPDGMGDTLQPIVARLPRGRGFLAGWTMGEGMCGALDAGVYPDEESAALAAHCIAERDAERAAQEEQEEWERRQREDEGDDD